MRNRRIFIVSSFILLVTLCVSQSWSLNLIKRLKSPPIKNRVAGWMAKSGVDVYALDHTLDFYINNYTEIDNTRFITIIDYSKHSSEERFYVFDMEQYSFDVYLVAHGRGSDGDHDGYADDFSNVSGSKQTSLGFMLTAETYSGKYGYSLRLDGLEERNSRARSRAIVIHGARYVNSDRGKLGRSWGCPALDMGVRTQVISQIKNGSLIYSFHQNFEM